MGTTDDYKPEGKYSLFKNINTHDEVEELLKRLDDPTIMSINFPERLEDHEHLLHTRRQKIIGLYDYDDLREAVFSGWSGSKSLESKYASLEEKVIFLEATNKDLETKLDKLRDMFDRIMTVLGDKKVEISIKDYVGELDAED